MKNRNLDADDNWATPVEFYNSLNDEFNFDFDPCPYNPNVEIDGLVIPWGKSNFINPPYTKKLKEAFVMKAIEESKNGAVCVLLLPVSTSTKLFHDHIQPNAKEIRFVKGRIKFLKMDADGKFYTPKSGGMHDSMIVVLKNT
jgi:hypothetical protein